ncbi:hypothetical protein KBT16_23655 [Nostoc sp. CCCryo 231-06]|nr:hypothetical protein [Nostoc sp. CCCryo 231-06]
MFYVLLVIGHGLAASYLLPITHKKGAGGAEEAGGAREAGEAGEAGEVGELTNAQCPMPNAQCPMPNAQCPIQKLSI